MKKTTPMAEKDLAKLFGLLILIVCISLIITYLVTRNLRQPDITSLRKIETESLSKNNEQARPGKHLAKPAVVAGQFYPADKNELYNTIEKMLGSRPALGLNGVQSILVPHAGYIYSGEIAAASFREIIKNFKQVFILAANHNGQADFKGVSIPAFTHYAIPGVEIPLDSIADELLQYPLFINEPKAHTMHMIEVELPFLYQISGRPIPINFTIIPMIVGRLDQNGIKHLAKTLNKYNTEESLFVFSVDLSHFYNYETCRKLDNFTIQAVLSHDRNSLSQAITDGNQVLLTMLELAELNGWESTLLARGNSGDITGEKERVVGYASIVFHQPLLLSKDEQKELLNMARCSIKQYLDDSTIIKPGKNMLERHPLFRVPRGVFVTLKKNGELRGCIGELVPQKSLIVGVQTLAIESAIQDTRFQPVTKEELNDLQLSISILDFPTQVKVSNPEDFPKALHPGKDGIILIHKGRQSTYLPQVWQQLPDPVAFLSNLCLKQGSLADCWKDKDTILYRYSAYEFEEKLPRDQ